MADGTHHHDHGGLFPSHAPVARIRTAFFLTLVILLVEVAGGLISHSLALMSDAGHVLTDIAAIGLAWFALLQGEKPADINMTFGYYRSGVLAAFINGILLILIMLTILWEAYRRFQNPQPVHGTWMFVSAAVGLGLNLYLALGMRREENINVKSAVLHMFGDAAASAGVIIGGVLILLTKWYVIDPVLSVLIAALIAAGAWSIVKQAMLILMEGVPVGIDFQGVVDELKEIPCIFNVHDLHIWSITSGKNALSCHIVCDGEMTVQQSQVLLRDIEHRLAHHNINHVTVQVENRDHNHNDSPFCSDRPFRCRP
ncbi:MAG: cation diffusion facilitator family transporter [Peptococcaceae bacterium]|nr:cation diffusion facilitator family transporter [Peptococcaceae bacterium]